MSKKFTDKVHSKRPESAEVGEAATHADSSAVEVEALKQEKEKLNHQLLVLAADYDNYRKRIAKEVEDASKYSISKFAKELVEVLENLHRAESSIKVEDLENNTTLKQIFTGVELTKKALLEAFERNGISRIHPLNEPFNHDLHQAITEMESASHPSGTVLQVIQAGYTLHGRLLRPALVVVSKQIEN